MRDKLIKIFKNNRIIIVAEILIILAFATFYGNFGDLFVDSFREAYIPQRVLEGKLLYKDIFVIYPPFAYLFNALLFLIFGIKLKVLYLAGLAATMGITYLTYKIADMFLDKIYIGGILLFLISGLVLSSNVFNPFFPYSYGILYGLLFILISIYAGLNKNFILAYITCALSVCSKYEFLLFIPILLFMSGKKDLLKNLGYYVLTILIIWAPLFICGLKFNDIRTSFELISIMTSTKTLHWFYSSMGLEFRIELIPIYLTNMIKFAIPLSWKLWQEVIIWAFPAILIGFGIRFKSLNYRERIFVLSSLLISVKVFFALTLQAYGAFFLPFALISLFILIPQKLRKFVTIPILIWGLIIGAKNIESYVHKDTRKLDEIVEFVRAKTSSEDKVLVYPEALGVNVLADRVSDDKFYSLIPLYVETFGEDVIIKRLELTKPKYIIISNYDTSAYYFHRFGYDYAINITEWIKENYTLNEKLNSGFIVYKKKL